MEKSMLMANPVFGESTDLEDLFSDDAEDDIFGDDVGGTIQGMTHREITEWQERLAVARRKEQEKKVLMQQLLPEVLAGVQEGLQEVELNQIKPEPQKKQEQDSQSFPVTEVSPAPQPIVDFEKMGPQQTSAEHKSFQLKSMLVGGGLLILFIVLSFFMWLT